METCIPSVGSTRESCHHVSYSLRHCGDKQGQVMVLALYGDHPLAERTCQKWFARLKSGNFDLEDEERTGAPPKFEDIEFFNFHSL
ncbi:hypothetical protein LAZ67_3000487 [Cordylochernes scorpioides]|uniref:Mos1 transposase HTH domain-containing protein n=1 Tax=Cordylochernes scorpioides TaxID=51811 RepID=A0ABY6K9M3_9ARAC|nr:hypothetical protein LAZ67_3000487 [Cordylochernes scorpioides]